MLNAYIYIYIYIYMCVYSFFFNYFNGRAFESFACVRFFFFLHVIKV